MSIDDNGTPIQACPFVYPNDDEPTVVQDDGIRKLLDWLVYYVLTAKNPILCLSAVAYSSGYDLGYIFNCPNTARGISKSLGVCHVQFHKEIQKIGKELQLYPRINNGNNPQITIHQSIQYLSGSIA